MARNEEVRERKSRKISEKMVTKNGKENKLTANSSGDKQNKFQSKSYECDCGKCIKKTYRIT